MYGKADRFLVVPSLELLACVFLVICDRIFSRQNIWPHFHFNLQRHHWYWKWCSWYSTTRNVQVCVSNFIYLLLIPINLTLRVSFVRMEWRFSIYIAKVFSVVTRVSFFLVTEVFYHQLLLIFLFEWLVDPFWNYSFWNDGDVTVL